MSFKTLLKIESWNTHDVNSDLVVEVISIGEGTAVFDSEDL